MAVRIVFDDKAVVVSVEFDDSGTFKPATHDIPLDELTKPPVLVAEAVPVQLARPGGDGGGNCVIVNGRLICP